MDRLRKVRGSRGGGSATEQGESAGDAGAAVPALPSSADTTETDVDHAAAEDIAAETGATVVTDGVAESDGDSAVAVTVDTAVPGPEPAPEPVGSASPPAANWEVRYDEEGDAYFYNTVSQHAQWDEPAGWQQHGRGSAQNPGGKHGGGGSGRKSRVSATVESARSGSGAHSPSAYTDLLGEVAATRTSPGSRSPAGGGNSPGSPASPGNRRRRAQLAVRQPASSLGAGTSHSGSPDVLDDSTDALAMVLQLRREVQNSIRKAEANGADAAVDEEDRGGAPGPPPLPADATKQEEEQEQWQAAGAEQGDQQDGGSAEKEQQRQPLTLEPSQVSSPPSGWDGGHNTSADSSSLSANADSTTTPTLVGLLQEGSVDSWSNVYEKLTDPGTYTGYHKYKDCDGMYHSFTPDVNPLSHLLVERIRRMEGQAGDDAVQRFKHWVSGKEKRLEKKKRELEHSYAPTIDPISEELAFRARRRAQRDEFPGADAEHELTSRLQKKALERDARIEQLRAQQAIQEQPTFSPQITRKSAEIVEEKKRRPDQSDFRGKKADSVFDRLASPKHRIAQASRVDSHKERTSALRQMKVHDGDKCTVVAWHSHIPHRDKWQPFNFSIEGEAAWNSPPVDVIRDDRVLSGREAIQHEIWMDGHRQDYRRHVQSDGIDRSENSSTHRHLPSPAIPVGPPRRQQQVRLAADASRAKPAYKIKSIIRDAVPAKSRTPSSGTSAPRVAPKIVQYKSQVKAKLAPPARATTAPKGGKKSTTYEPVGSKRTTPDEKKAAMRLKAAALNAASKATVVSTRAKQVTRSPGAMSRVSEHPDSEEDLLETEDRTESADAFTEENTGEEYQDDTALFEALLAADQQKNGGTGTETEADDTMEVVCPDDVLPGDELEVTAPDGSLLSVVVPEGVAPGETFELQLGTGLPDAPTFDKELEAARVANIPLIQQKQAIEKLPLGVVAGTAWELRRDNDGILFVHTRTKATVFEAPQEVVAVAVSAASLSMLESPSRTTEVISPSPPILKAGPAVVLPKDTNSTSPISAQLSAGLTRVRLPKGKLPKRPPPRKTG